MALQSTHRMARQAFLEEHSSCWFCGAGNPSVHEIVCGVGVRHIAFGERCTWAAACWDCNSGQLCDYSVWPVERQCAVKALRDPDWFDLPRLCEIKGRAVTAIVLADVVKYLTLIERE